MCQQDCFREDLPGESVQMFKMFKCSKMLKCSNIPKNWQVQAWGSSSPHKHGMTSLKEHGNNCRNPDNYSSPWYVPFHRLLCFGKLASFGLIFDWPKYKRKAASAPSISKDFLALSTHFGWHFTTLKRSSVYCE